jgi:hypothetical protein
VPDARTEEDVVTSPSERTRPNDRTRKAEHEDERTTARADREPTAEEEKLAERDEIDPDVADHHVEMIERGANQQGEGPVP